MVARICMVTLLALFGLLQVQLWLTPNGMREVLRLHGEIAAQREHNRQLARRNALLDAEVADLRNGLAAIEERARTDLGMIRANETFYRSAHRTLSPAAAARERESAAP